MPPTRRQRQQDPVLRVNTSHTQTDNNVENTSNVNNSESANTAINSSAPPITEDISSESDQDLSSKHSSHSKPKLQLFKGLNDKITVENWLKRFEMLATFYKWSSKTKIVMLGNYLEDDSLNWYVENYQDGDSYDSLKCKIIARFGIETTEPIIDFINLRYDVKQGIKTYFENKRRFGVAAKLTEQQMIPVMIHGLHPKMTEYFTAVKPKTYSEFYSIAQTAENNFKRTFNRNSEQSVNKQKQKSDNDKVKKKPPEPCRICERLGYKNRFHWANECRNKGKTNTQNTNKTVNSVNRTDNELSDNDLARIDLN